MRLRDSDVIKLKSGNYVHFGCLERDTSKLNPDPTPDWIKEIYARNLPVSDEDIASALAYQAETYRELDASRKPVLACNGLAMCRVSAKSIFIKSK